MTHCGWVSSGVPHGTPKSPVSHFAVLTSNSSLVSNSSFLLVHTLEAPVGESSSTWIPVTHMGDLDWIPSSWFQPDPVLVVAGIWVSEHVGGRSLFLCLINKTYKKAH